MIRFSAAPAFDFDEWAQLARQDPGAFEARRRALLAIEIARGGPHAQEAKAMIEHLESQLDGRDAEERMRVSMNAMAASARLMSDRLSDLSATLAAHVARHERTPPV